MPNSGSAISHLKFHTSHFSAASVSAHQASLIAEPAAVLGCDGLDVTLNEPC